MTHFPMPAMALAAALACAACAPPPAPRQAPPPPSHVPSPGPVPTPARPAPSAPFRLDAEPLVDVGLAWDLDVLKMAPLTSTPVFVVTDGVETRLGATRDPIEARFEGGTWRIAWINSGRQTMTPLAARDTLMFGAAHPPSDGGPAAPVATWDGKTWRGRLKVFAGPRGRLTIVCRVPLETYLLGVVPGEIGALAENLIEAGRAQAIAARSYTLFYRGRRADEGFDLYATVEDQLYGPTEVEKPLATRCVTGTSGQLALGEGAPIRANYSSTCGGITADVWEGWPVDGISYLVGHRDADGGADFCADSRHYRWSEQWSAAEFAEILSRYAPAEGVALPTAGVGAIEDVRVASRSRSGRVWRLEVTTTTGRIVVHAHVLRRVIRRPGAAAATLRSNLFKIGVRRDPRDKVVAVVASGAGFGHGVGLCQTGALGMARAGRSSEQILLHYYPGIEIRRMY